MKRGKIIFIFLFVIISLFLNLVISTDPPAVEWSQVLNGAGEQNDGFESVTQISGENYVVTGTYDAGGPGGANQFWIMRVDSSGNHVWNETHGGALDDGAKSIIQTSDGGYILAGYTASYGAGSYDVWIVKTNSTGGQTWARTYGDSNNDVANSIKQTSDGGYILVGYSDVGADGNEDAILMKTNSTGDSDASKPGMWNVTFDWGASDNLFSFQEISGDNYILAGKNGSDFWIIKTNSTGGHVWNKTYDKSANDIAYSINQTNDGGFLVSGTNGTDGWIIKTNSTGDHVWNKTHDSGGSDSIKSVITSDSDFVFAGQANNNAWVFKLNSTGDLIWNQTYNYGSGDIFNEIEKTPDDGFIAVGLNGTDALIIKLESDAVSPDLPPNTTLIRPANDNLTRNATIDFSCNASDDFKLRNISLYVWNLTGEVNYTNTISVNGTFNQTSWNVTFEIGNYSWNCLAYDNLSNGSWAASNFSYEILSPDGTPPQINITYPGNITYTINVSELNFSYTEANPDKCWYTIDNGATNSTPTSYANFTSTTSLEGTNNLTLYCNDTYGNENFNSTTFYQDSILPVVNFTQDTTSSGNYSQSDVFVNSTASDTNLQTIVIYLYNSTDLVNSTNSSIGDNSIQINFTGLADETYYLNASANDTLGNINWTETRTIVLDTAVPIITSVSASPSDTTATISWTTDETSNSTVYYGTTTPTPAITSSNSFVISHSIGLSGLSASTFYYFNVSSCDAAGNCNTSIQYNFTTTATAVPTTTEDPGGGGGSPCTSECSDAEEESSCEGTAVRYRVCGNYDADICKEWSDYQYTSCEEDEYCEDAVCIPAICEENWECDWTDCSDGFSYPQNCIDLNECGTSLEIPTPIQCHIPPMPTIPTTGPGGGGGGGGGSSCVPNWKCDKWGDCSVNYSLQDLLQDKTKYEGVQERTCTDGNNCYNPSTQEKSCSLNKQISARKIDWCNDKYVEIYSKKNELVGRIKETKLLTLDKIDIGFMISNFTGYCAYCYDGVKNFDEEEKDCGGPNCPPCPRFRSLSMWIKIIAWILWLLLLILILIIVGVYFREKYRRDLWKRKFRRAWLFLRSGR